MTSDEKQYHAIRVSLQEALDYLSELKNSERRNKSDFSKAYGLLMEVANVFEVAGVEEEFDHEEYILGNLFHRIKEFLYS